MSDKAKKGITKKKLHSLLEKARMSRLYSVLIRTHERANIPMSYSTNRTSEKPWKLDEK